MAGFLSFGVKTSMTGHTVPDCCRALRPVGPGEEKQKQACHSAAPLAAPAFTKPVKGVAWRRVRHRIPPYKFSPIRVV